MKRLNTRYTSVDNFIFDLEDTCVGTDRVMLFAKPISELNLREEQIALSKSSNIRLNKLFPEREFKIASQLSEDQFQDFQTYILEENEYQYQTFSTHCCVLEFVEGKQNIPYYLEIDVLFDKEEESPVAVRAYLEVCAGIAHEASGSKFYQFTDRYNKGFDQAAVDSLKLHLTNPAIHFVSQAISVTEDCDFAKDQALKEGFVEYAL